MLLELYMRDWRWHIAEGVDEKIDNKQRMDRGDEKSIWNKFCMPVIGPNDKHDEDSHKRWGCVGACLAFADLMRRKIGRTKFT